MPLNITAHKHSYPRGHLLSQREIPGLFYKGYQFYVNTRAVHNARWPKNKWYLIPYNEWLEKARDYARARRAKYLTSAEKRIKKNRWGAEYKLNKKFEDLILHRYGAWPTYKNEIYHKLHNRRNHQYVNPPYYPDIKQEKEQWLNERMLRAYDRAKQKTKEKVNK